MASPGDLRVSTSPCLRVIFGRIRVMKALFHMMAFLALVVLGGILVIKLLYGCSWRESVDIADQFVSDLLG